MSSQLATRLTLALRGRYRIERLLGQGGMACVFLAKSETDGRMVAIKTLLPDLADSVGAERFLREIEMERQLVHPGIIPVLDAGDANGAPFYVMPFVEGESLRDRMDREKQIPLAEAIAITRAAADALAFAHARGIVHRDVKPENILIGDGSIVLADFGIARAVVSAGGAKLTQTGMIVGTPSYLAPELTTGLAPPTPAADQYGLACLVYEMIAGVPPFKGPTSVAIMTRHALEPPPGLRIVQPEIPEYVEAAIKRALAKKPEERFATVAEFADALEGKAVAPAAPKAKPAEGGTPKAKSGCAGLVLLASAAAAGAVAGVLALLVP